jgi:DNA-binding transcriptional LysR family regulator
MATLWVGSTAHNRIVWGLVQVAFVNVRLLDLRYFVAVAEELSFTRAADRLYVAQQGVSAQVRQVERQVGVQLLERTTRRMRLTPAGEVFLEHARGILAAADAAVEATRRAVGGGRLRIGFLAAAALELTHPILVEFERRHPQVEVRMHEHRVDEPSAGLRSDEADVALVRAPFASDGLVLEALAAEPLALMMPASHPLAREPAVGVADLTGLAMVTVRTRDPVWRDFWVAAHERLDGAPRLVEVETFEEQMEAVGAGRGVSLTGSAAARFYSRPDLAYRQVCDLPTCDVAVAWRRGDANPLIARFVETALAVRDVEREVVAMISRGLAR